ncbi:MAG TPA: PilZ domain-containing protein [Thermoanaerobaculaceae bacterium]|nr:PilZ domain-containing protein [Thermoanaerobaculaceae bacterium]
MDSSVDWYTVLPVGFDPAGLERLRGALTPIQVVVTGGADDWSEAVELACVGHYDALAVAYPLRGAPMSTFLAALRKPACPCRSSSVVLVAHERYRAEAEMYLGRGANRVVSWEEVELRLPEVLDRLFSTAPRLPLTIPSRIQEVADRPAKRLDCRTVNISTTGMLLDVPNTFRPGTVLAFELILPGSHEPIRGRARVVRRTAEPTEPFSGVGVVFAAFDESNEGRLTSYLDRFAS